MSENLVNETLDALSANICVLDEGGTILAVNQAWRNFAILNPPIPQNCMEGSNYLAVCDSAIGPDSGEAKAFASGIRKVMSRESKTFSLEYPCNSPTQERWFIGKVSRFIKRGELRIVVSHEDITDRKRAEEMRALDLARVDRRTKELQFLLKGATYVLEGADFTTTARRIFDAAREMTGAQSGYVALLSESGEENEVLFLESGGLACSVDPCLPMPIRGLRGEAYRLGGVALDNDFMNSKWAAFMPAGHVELKNVMFVPLNIEGKTMGIMGLANKQGDFTEDDRSMAWSFGQLAAIALQKSRSTDALRQSEEFIRAVMDHLPIGVAVNSIGPAVCFHYMNDNFSRFYRTTRESLAEPDRFWDSVYEDSAFREEIKKRVLDDCASGDPDRMHWEDVPVARKGEETAFISARNTLVPGKQLMISTVWDVTDRKRAEEEKNKLQAQLLQAQKMESVGRLAGGVAHDFNNKLGIIIGNVEMAMMRVQPKDPIYLELDEIFKAGQRSADLVRQLLAFARKQTINPKVLDLNATVSSMLNMLRRLIGEDIHLAWMPGMDLRPVKIDPSQIDQILANLMVNARDAINGVGKVTIETDNVSFDETYCGEHPGFVPGNYVLMAVSDDGAGMIKGVHEHIFEPFFTTKEVGKGTGLGLATVYGIVKQNNGFINVYSEPGKGTTFRIYFPRFEDEKGETEVPNAQPVEGGSETVLIVEDETAILKIGKALLESLGYRVLTANTPKEAIQMARGHSLAIDLLLTDVVMPEMNGRALAEEIKLIHPRLKCLYMSGYTANVIAHHSILDEGVNFVEKPFTLKNLAAKVRQALDR
jgi:signal transduction histidine kinase